MDLKGAVIRLLLVIFVPLVAAEGPRVCIPKQGCVLGTYMPGYQTGLFEAFMGIPFASPPVGNLRFANPRPSLPWVGTLDATVPKPECIQKQYLLPSPVVTGEEDCLYLNVYRPIASSKPLPVMVYIHGGGFFSGSPTPYLHGPEYFMDTKEVILVTIAYRLGPLGFLSTGDVNMPGNFGLKDQQLALKWVFYNIGSFGGDANKITIFGQSAGAVSVHYHVITSEYREFFHQAIMLSGSAITPFALLEEDPLEQALNQARFVGIDAPETMSTKLLTKVLRTIDAYTLVDSGDSFKYWHTDPLTTFRPVIEQPHPEAFITKHPNVLLQQRNYSRVPLLITMVPEEGAVRSAIIISNETLTNDFNAEFDHLLYKLMEMPEGTDEASAVDMMTSVYFKSQHELNPQTMHGLIDIVSDRGFHHPFYNLVKIYAEDRHQYLSLQKFSYQGPYSYSTIYTGTNMDLGVVHCDDLIYLFRSPILFPDFPKNSTDARMIKELVDHFVYFATEGETKVFDEEPLQCIPFNFEHSDGFCPYYEFEGNTQDGYGVFFQRSFNTQMTRFWDLLLNEA